MNTIAPNPSKETDIALVNLTGKCKQVQAGQGKILAAPKVAERLLQEVRDAKKKNKNPDKASKHFLGNLTKAKEMKVTRKQNVKSANVCGAATIVKKQSLATE